jgi:hypothetical protein
MNSRRAAELLEAMASHRAPAMSSEELAALAGAGLVVSYDRGPRDTLVSQAGRLPGVTERVRELSRAVHGWTNGTGAVVPSRSPSGARDELRAAINELEGLTRAQALLDSLVWNDATESFCCLTLEGRQGLADLHNWGVRLGDLSFEEFRARLGTYRGSLSGAVGRADMILQAMLTMDLMEVNPEFTRADLRLASIALTSQPDDRFRVVNEFAHILSSPIWQGARREDWLVGAVALAALPGDASAAMERFQRTRAGLARHGIVPDEELVVAAAFVDLPVEHIGTAMARLAALRGARPGMGPVVLSGLARSGHTVEDAARRVDEITAGLARLGFADGEQMGAAGSILAASALPVDQAVERFRAVAGRLPGAFYSPLVAGAMLATSPLEPMEAVETLEECIGAVTRANFFDLTMEIESLALILAYVVGPVDLRASVSGVPPPLLAAPPIHAAPASVWLVPHNVWVYRPIVRYIASHPAHVHTIAGFA